MRIIGIAHKPCSPAAANPLGCFCVCVHPQAAFNAAASSGAAMLYLAGKYGIGSELTFAPVTTVMAEPTARFVSGEGWAALALATPSLIKCRRRQPTVGPSAARALDPRHPLPALPHRPQSRAIPAA